jgi:hypothetical protein
VRHVVEQRQLERRRLELEHPARLELEHPHLSR